MQHGAAPAALFELLAGPAGARLVPAEVIKQLVPWKTMQDVEWETMHWVDWYNIERLLGSIGYIPPAEAERLHLEQAQPMDKVA